MTAMPLQNAHIRRYRISELEPESIRRTPEGAIDLDYYLTRAHQARGRAVRGAFRKLVGLLTRRPAPASRPLGRLAPCG
ncbi:MAG: hypothetical protein QNJ94_21090 [Alphaproteobacteria bacterium]|nr:hypothetical protein [Alphaproteobacteria bacterium]